MKRLIFFLALFSLTFSATMATHAATTATDMIQKSFVITQITPMPVMAVNFEPATAVYNFTGVNLPAEQTITVKTYTLDSWRNPDWGSLAISCNANSIKFKDAYCNREIQILSPHTYAINRTPNNYNINYSYGLRD